MNYSHAPRSIDDIFALLSHSCEGRHALAAARPLLRTRRLEVRAYPSALSARLAAAQTPGHPIGACTVRDGDHVRIYLHLESPLGVLAPFLFHELVHALDPALALANGKQGAERRATLIESEIKAYRLQAQFVAELKQALPLFARFLDEKYPAVRALDARISADEVRALYTEAYS